MAHRYDARLFFRGQRVDGLILIPARYRIELRYEAAAEAIQEKGQLTFFTGRSLRPIYENLTQRRTLLAITFKKIAGTFSLCQIPRGEFRMSKVVAFLKDDSGATAIEYGLIAAGISVVIIATVNAIGVTLNTKFDSISTQLK